MDARACLGSILVASCGASLIAVLTACGGDDGSSGSPKEGSGGNGASSGSSSGASGPGSGGSVGSGSLDGCPVFPVSNAWNAAVDGLDVHPNSDAFVDAIGRDDTMHPDFGTEWEGAPIGIPYVVVAGSQAKVAIEFVAYGEESDPGPYPVPATAPVEGGPDSDGDRHVLVVDKDACLLYELYRAFPQTDGSWQADSGAIWDLSIDDAHPLGWTSADAAGLPILPGLVRYDEVVDEGVIPHALRFTVPDSQSGFIPPASHYASSDSNPDLPPMGLRMRMKAAYDCSAMSAEAQVVCTALKTFGMIVADNGSGWYVSGAPDPRWDDEALGDLKSIPGDAFEAVFTGDVETY